MMRFFWCAYIVGLVEGVRPEISRVKAHASAHASTGGCGPANTPTTLTFRNLSGAAFCADGTPSGYYAKQAVNMNSKKLVIYMKGGGGCTDNATCWNWTLKSTCKNCGRVKGSSNGWQDTKEVKPDPKRNTIFLSDDPEYNPYFCDAHHVYVPYCTGDSHMGQVTEASSASWDLVFSGHENFKAIIEDLKPRIPFQSGLEILLYGTSGGARGVITNCDWLMDNWPEADVSCSSWAGWYFPGNIDNPETPDLPPTGFESEPISYDHARAAFTALTTAHQLFLPERCANSVVQVDQFKCYYAHNVYKTLVSPMFIVEDLFDYSKLGYLNLKIQAPPTQDEADYLALYSQALKESTSGQLKDGDGVFLPSCYGHGTPHAVLQLSNGESLTRDRVTGMWYEGILPEPSDYVLIDECSDVEGNFAGIPCGTGCNGPR